VVAEGSYNTGWFCAILGVHVRTVGGQTITSINALDWGKKGDS